MAFIKLTVHKAVRKRKFEVCRMSGGLQTTTSTATRIALFITRTLLENQLIGLLALIYFRAIYVLPCSKTMNYPPERADRTHLLHLSCIKTKEGVRISADWSVKAQGIILFTGSACLIIRSCCFQIPTYTFCVGKLYY